MPRCVFQFRRFRSPLVSLILALLLAATASIVAAQGERRRLSIEAIYGDELSGPSPSQIRWSPSGTVSFFLSDDDGRRLWELDAETGERRVLVDAETLSEHAPSANEATTDERERTRRTRFGVPDYLWSPDGDRILLASAGAVVLYHPETAEVTRLAPDKTGVLDPKFSPDGERVAFVYEHDLWVVPVSGGAEKQLTFGGSEWILHGDLDWVYPEELGVRTGYHWSPDGRRIAFLELDETLVPAHPIVEEISRQATADLQRYPKPGDPNPRVRVGIVDVETGATAWIDRAAEYIPRIDWVDGETVAIQLLNRGQDRLEIVLVDARTGRSRSLLAETDPYWIDLTNDLTFLESGRRFLWTSQRTGLRHIYLYEYEHNGGVARLVRALTEGDWRVSGIEGVDEAAGFVYFSANRDNPIGSDLYRVRLDGSGLSRLTTGKGTHAIDMRPDAKVYLDRFSSMADPGHTTLRRLDGKENGELDFHAEPSLEELGLDLVEPDYRLIDAPDGAKIGILMLRPRELEPEKKYPLVVYVYGMPGFPSIRDAWGGNRYLFHQFLVQQGYVVAQIDDRTAAVWGHRYAALGDHNIGPIAVADHGVAVEHLTSFPYIDANRMGVWGWSGGGFTTTFHMTHTKLFQIGVAGAPVTDWHLYDSIYTERYMGTPQDDPEAYERTSSVEAAANAEGRLLLIHGSHDDNVHPQNTMKLIDALIEARKPYELLIYPNKTHGIRGQNAVIHLWTSVFDFMERYLKTD